MRKSLLAALLAALLLAAGLPAVAQTPVPELVYETYTVETDFDNDGDGTNETINVEVMRDASVENAPVILTYTPYAILAGQRAAEDSYAARYVPQGYARAVADVLGTRGSSGCWNYGGLDEQQSGVDVVNFLAEQPWSNGNVGMIGGSYDGTTASMVAARGDDAPGLKAIVPIVGISRWYGYAYSGGVRYALNSERPTDEGLDTPFAFDFGFGRVPPLDYTQPGAFDAGLDRLRVCESLQNTDRGYFNPNYDEFWLDRDYRKDAANFRAATLVAHGWQDYNVKQEEGVELFKALPVDRPGTAQREGVPFKQLFVYQSGHASPRGAVWQSTLDNFFDHTLKGVNNGAQNAPTVFTEGRATTAAGTYETIPLRNDASWPPPRTQSVSLRLGRGVGGGTLSTGAAGPSNEASYTDVSATTEEVARMAPRLEASWLAYASPALAGDVRMADRAVLDLQMEVDRDSAHLTPVLIDVAPNGTWRTVSRTFLDLQYRNSLARPTPLPVNQPFRARVEFKNQDHTFRAGHRIAVLVQSSNTIWAIPDTPGANITVLHPRSVSGRQGSFLNLPLVNPPARSAMFAP